MSKKIYTILAILFAGITASLGIITLIYAKTITAIILYLLTICSTSLTSLMFVGAALKSNPQNTEDTSNPQSNYIECHNCTEHYDCERTYLGGCMDGKAYNSEELTDEQIIKALECCTVEEVPDCENCPLLRESCAIIRKYALDLIRRQKNEIERMTKWKDKLQDTKDKMEIKNIAKLSSYGAYIDEEFIYTDSLVKNKKVIVGNIAEYMYDLEQEIERLTEEKSFATRKMMESKAKAVELQKQVDKLTEENKKLSLKVWNYEQPARTPLYNSESMVNCNLVTCYNENFELKAKNAELQKQVNTLKTENTELHKEHTTLIAGSILKQQDIVKNTAEEIDCQIRELFYIPFEGKTEKQKWQRKGMEEGLEMALSIVKGYKNIEVE